MSLVVPNCGEAIWLAAALGITPPVTPFHLRLFANDYTPVGATVAGDLTECTDDGYAAIDLDDGDWTVTPGAPTTATQPTLTFVFTDAGDPVYGFYVTDDAGVLLWAERFDDAFTPEQAGDSLEIDLEVTLASVSGD